MKKKFVIIVLSVAAITVSYMLGTAQAKTVTVTKKVETVPDGYIDTTSYDFKNNYVDMRQVTDYSENEQCLQLNMSDGSSYLYEKE